MLFEPLKASLTPDMTALDGGFVLHVVDVAGGAWREGIRIVVWLLIGFVGGFCHIEPEGVGLIEKMACAQVTAGSDDSDNEKIACNQVRTEAQPVPTFVDDEINDERQNKNGGYGAKPVGKSKKGTSGNKLIVDS